MPTSAVASAAASLMPRAVLVAERLEAIHLFVRRKPCVGRDPEAPFEAAGRRGAIAREDRHGICRFLHRRYRVLGVRRQPLLDAEKPPHRRVVHNVEGCAPGLRLRRKAIGEGARRRKAHRVEQPLVAHAHPAARSVLAHVAHHPRPGVRRHVCGWGERQATSLRCLDDGRGKGVAGALLHRRGAAQQRVVGRCPRLARRPPLGAQHTDGRRSERAQGARLVKRDGAGLSQVEQRLAGAYQQPLPSRLLQRHGQRQRNGDAQRAGTGDEDHAKRHVEGLGKPDGRPPPRAPGPPRWE